MAEFGSVDLEEVVNEGTRLNEGGAGNFLDQFVPMPEVKPGQTGSVALRILPPAKGERLFQYNRTHKINGRSVHCPRPLKDGKWERNVPCPICDYYSSLWKEIDKLEKKHGKDCPEAEPLKQEARDLKPTERYYYNAIVRTMLVDGKELKNVGPRILSVGIKVHKMIIRAICGEEGDPESKLGDVTSLKAGWDFIIRKEVSTGDGYPNYDRSGFARSQSVAGSPEEIAKWAENLHDLKKLRNPREMAYLEKELAIHRGLIPDEAEGFDTAGFDAKWGGGKSNTEKEVETLAAKAAAQTTTDTAPVTETVTETTTIDAPASEDVTMSGVDEDFLKELEGMNNG